MRHFVSVFFNLREVLAVWSSMVIVVKSCLVKLFLFNRLSLKIERSLWESFGWYFGVSFFTLVITFM